MAVHQPPTLQPPPRILLTLTILAVEHALILVGQVQAQEDRRVVGLKQPRQLLKVVPMISRSSVQSVNPEAFLLLLVLLS